MIQNTKLYRKGYQSDLLIGRDEARPWNLETEILRFSSPDTIMLDIGSGTAKKLIPLAKHVRKIIALEPSHEMWELAQETIASHNIKNIDVIDGLASKLPFEDSKL